MHLLKEDEISRLSAIAGKKNTLKTKIIPNTASGKVTNMIIVIGTGKKEKVIVKISRPWFKYNPSIGRL